MSEPLDNTIQFLSDSVVHLISEVAKSAAHRVVNSIASKFSTNTKPESDSVVESDSPKMFKWENSSNAGTSSTSSGRSIGDKWKSIIGHIDDGPMLEDEDVPEEEFYQSSPEVNKFKSIDDTLLEAEPPKWRNVTDESFLKMEQMVMSPVRQTPLKRITEHEKEVDVTNLISFSPYGVKDKEIESSTADNDYETCESGESRMTEARKSSQQTSYNYITCESGESRITDGKVTLSWGAPHHNTLDDVDTLTIDNNSDVNSSQSSSHTKNDSNTSSQPSELEESLKFNDTLEEMEHLLKYGMNYINDKPVKEKSPEPKTCFEKYYDETKVNFNQAYDFTNSDASSSKESTSAMDHISLPKHNVEKYRDHQEIDVKSPVSKKTTVKKIQHEATANKENKFRLRSPRLVIPQTTASGYGKSTPLQPPSKTPTKPRRKFFYDTPPKTTPKVTPSKATTPLQLTPSNQTPSKYNNIMSPVQYYIKNSPVVPKIQNVSPGVNLWERHSQRAASTGRTIENPKENAMPLKEKAYHPPKMTRTIEAVDQRLPRNFKVGIMAKSLPKPVVIKHQRREGTTPLREQNTLSRQHTYTLSGGNRESYAELGATVGGDVSICIEKPAARTHTLK